MPLYLRLSASTSIKLGLASMPALIGHRFAVHVVVPAIADTLDSVSERDLAVDPGIEVPPAPRPGQQYAEDILEEPAIPILIFHRVGVMVRPLRRTGQQAGDFKCLIVICR